MGIDGVGKPGGVGPLGGATGADPTTGAAFRSELEGTARAEQAEPTTALSRLERGEISRDEYLDLRVNEAVSHLHGRLAPEQLEFVKDSLRQQLETDPVLVELVRRTTGAVAPDNER